MASFIVVCATALAVMFYSYFYLWLFSANWPHGGLPPPKAGLPLLAHVLLAMTGGAVFWSGRCFRTGKILRAQIGFVVIGLFSFAYIGLKAYIHAGIGFLPQDHAYGSIFFLTSWLFLLFILVGLGLVVAAMMRLWHHGREREGLMALQMQITGMFWYFIAGSGLRVFAVLYLAPYVLS